MPEDKRPEAFDRPQVGFIQRMIDATVGKLVQRILDRSIYAKHADLHGPFGRDAINFTGANTPGGGVPGLWPFLGEPVERTISGGVLTLQPTDSHVVVRGESGADDVLTTISGVASHRFVRLVPYQGASGGETITIETSGNITILGQFSGQMVYLDGTPTGRVIQLSPTGGQDTHWALLEYNGVAWTAAGMSFDEGWESWQATGLKASAAAVNAAIFPQSDAVTIASGVATVAGNFGILTSETGSSDDVTSFSVVNGEAYLENNGSTTFAVIHAASGHTITIKHDHASGVSGKTIFTTTSADIVLTSNSQWLLMTYDEALDSAAGGWWCIPLTPGIAGVSDLMNAATEVTIATGAITVVTRPEGIAHYIVRTEAAAATDILTTINGGTANEWIVLQANPSGGESIEIDNGGGNISLGGDIGSMRIGIRPQEWAMGFYESVTGTWFLAPMPTIVSKLLDENGDEKLSVTTAGSILKGIVQIDNFLKLASQTSPLDMVSNKWTAVDASAVTLGTEGGTGAEDSYSMELSAAPTDHTMMVMFHNAGDGAITFKHLHASGTTGYKWVTPDGADLVWDDNSGPALAFYRQALDSSNGAWAVSLLRGTHPLYYEAPATTESRTTFTAFKDYGTENAIELTINQTVTVPATDGQSFHGVLIQPTVIFTDDTFAGAAAFMYGYLWNPLVKSDGSGIAFAQSGSFVDDTRFVAPGGADTYTAHYAFRSHPSMTASGGGTMAMTDFIGYASGWRDLDTGWTITTYTDFKVEAGVADGGTITTRIGLDIEAFNEGTTQIGIRTAEDIRMISGAALNIWDDGTINLFTNSGTTQTGSWNANTGEMAVGATRTYDEFVTFYGANLGKTMSLDFAGGSVAMHGFSLGGTVAYVDAGSVFGLSIAFFHGATYINSADVDPGPIFGMVDGPTITALTYNIDLSQTASYFANQTFGISSGGSIDLTNWYGIVAGGNITATGVLVTTRYGIQVRDISYSGGAAATQITTNIALDIAAQTGTTAIGIRNASNYRGTGYLSLIGASAPNNTGDGELTASRVNIGNVAFASASLEFQMTGQGVIDGALLLAAAAAAPTNNTDGDFTALRGAFLSADAAFPNSEVRLWAHQGTRAAEVERTSTTGSARNPVRFTRQYDLATVSNATATETIATTTDRTWLIECFVTGVQTGGTVGSVGDSVGYIGRACIRNVAGTASHASGTGAIQVIAETDSGHSFSISTSGANLQLNCVGVTNRNVSWTITMDVYEVANA